MPTSRESLILDGLELNDLTGSYVLRSIDFPVPKKRYEWVTGADADGADLVRDPLFENRTIPASIRVAQQSTMDAALALVAQLVGKLEEAERQPGGLPLVWTPANSTKSITFYVLSGEIDGIPVTREGPDRGWLRNYPIVNLTMTCKPFGYGSLVSVAGSTSASTPLVYLEIPNVTGDVPAEGTIVVTDLATKARRDVIWGLEQRYYDTASPAAVLIAAGSLVTTGFAGAAGTLTGAYLSNVVSANVAGQPTAVCGTGNQPHVGTFRVRARVQVASTVARVRFSWQDGDGPFGSNPWATVPVAGGWCEVDLGPVTISPSKLGTQRWTGRIEAYTTDGTAQNVYVNLLELIPAGEGYGRARAPYAYRAGAVVARDDFTGFTTGNLNGRTAPLGGTWATAGTTTDFVGFAQDVTRSTVDTITGRYAVLGSAVSDSEVGARLFLSAAPNLNDAYAGVVARYVDTNNALRAYVNPKQQVFAVSPIVAGGSSAYTSPLAAVPPKFVRVRLIVFASGSVYATLTDDAGTIISTITLPAGTITALTPGQPLATGKAGIYDIGLAGGYPREYDDVYTTIPPAEPIVVNPGQSIEFRADDVLRRDATGTYGGRPPAYRGARVLLPPAGAVGRKSRVVIAARAGDTDNAVDGGVTDSTQVVVQYTPRYLAVPH